MGKQGVGAGGRADQSRYERAEGARGRDRGRLAPREEGNCLMRWLYALEEARQFIRDP